MFDDRRYERSLLCELVRGEKRLWRDVEIGKKLTYSGLVAMGAGRIFAALLSHSVLLDQKIDTRLDISAFQLMWFSPLLGWASGPVYDGDAWRSLVPDFYAGSSLSRWMTGKE